MTINKCFLAVDLGAESGRSVVGSYDGSTIRLAETHRFPNQPIRIHGSLHWDVLRLFGEIKDGLARSVRECAGPLVSLGLDTWGVDFGLLDWDGMLLANPYHYRDSMTDGMIEEAFRRAPREEIFGCTGIQFMKINTLYQLLALVLRGSSLLRVAESLLMMPDLFNYWLTGRQVCEKTIASTSQCLDPRTGFWATALLEKLEIPSRIFPELIQPGAPIEKLLPDIAKETGTNPISVIATGCHDTASAVAAVPRLGADDAYLSSGTWSLMGVETAQPVITSKSLEYNFTNEGGVCGTIRLLRNITGLWIIQECRRQWESEGQALSYDAITKLVKDAPPFVSLINPDDTVFHSPGDMPSRIRAYCARTEQPVPGSAGEVARTVMESLALKYRWVFERLQELVGRSLQTLRIVGGGARNQLLNQFAANALKRTVAAGPVEATSAGNVLMQMLAFGDISSLSEGRELMARSFDTSIFEPADSEAWDEAYGRFEALLNRV